MEASRCPRCHQASVIHGRMVAQDSSPDEGFVPRNVRLFRHVQVVPLAQRATYACVSCGHLWSAVDPAKLRQFIATWGEEIAKQELDEIDRGPYRDLPDISLAREIAENIAELDALVREGKPGGVARYREMRGVIWDEAINAMRRWTKLTREEKLALFGWEPKAKTKAAADDLGEPLL